MVEYSGPLSDSVIDLELLWEHGHSSDDYKFQFAYSGGVRSDGGAVVADVGNREVIQIGPDGSFAGVLARTGRGPSEVLGPRAVLVLGFDTVWIEDPANAKLIRFVGGTVTATVSTSGNRTLTFGMMPLGVDADGDLLMATSSFRSDFDQPWLDGHLTHFSVTELRLDTVASYPMAPRTSRAERNPYAPYGVVTSAARGFVHARTDVPQIIWRDSNGDVTQIVRWHPTPRYPDGEMWEQFESSLRADLRRVNPGMSGERLQTFVNEQVASYSVDTSKPVPLFGQLRGTPEGDVWMAGFAPGNSRPSRYFLVSHDGTSVGVVDFGRPFRVVDASEEFVMGVFTDDLDVQGVAMYRYRSIL